MMRPRRSCSAKRIEISARVRSKMKEEAWRNTTEAAQTLAMSPSSARRRSSTISTATMTQGSQRAAR